MARHRLHNERWGFASNCFVCEPKNPGGLAIPFDHDDEAATVVAKFTLDDQFSGAPSYVHGGISLAILDEAQGWAAIAVGGKFAVTVETSTRFAKPVHIGRTYEVEARIEGQTERLIHTSAEIRRPDGVVCASSSATFAVLSAATAADAIGSDVTADHGEYLR